MICFNYQPELCNGESNNVWKAISVANGSKFYNDPEKLPLEVFQYTPIFEFPMVIIAKLFNKSSAEYLANVTHFGRLFILLLNILLSFIIYRLCTKILEMDSHKSALCALSSIMLLTHPIFTIRPDSSLLLLIFITVYYYLQQIKKTTYKFTATTYLILSLLISLCFFAKQDGLMISAVIGIDLLLNKRYKQLVLLIIITLVTLSVVLTISHFVFGEFFFKSVILGLNNTSSITQVIIVFEKAWSYYGLILTLGLFTAFYLLYKKNNSKTIPIGIIIYLFIALLTSSKSGSWINYYTPSVLLSTVGIFYIINKYNSSLRNIVLGSILLTVALFSVRITYNYTYPLTKQKKNEYFKAYTNVQLLKSKLNITPKTKILLLDFLERNMLSENCILINTEYYGYSKYKYHDFKNQRNKPIKYIIYHPKDIAYINYLSSLFNIQIQNYKHLKIRNYEVLVNPSI